MLRNSSQNFLSLERYSTKEDTLNDPYRTFTNFKTCGDRPVSFDQYVADKISTKQYSQPGQTPQQMAQSTYIKLSNLPFRPPSNQDNRNEVAYHEQYFRKNIIERPESKIGNRRSRLSSSETIRTTALRNSSPSNQSPSKNNESFISKQKKIVPTLKLEQNKHVPLFSTNTQNDEKFDDDQAINYFDTYISTIENTNNSLNLKNQAFHNMVHANEVKVSLRLKENLHGQRPSTGIRSNTSAGSRIKSSLDNYQNYMIEVPNKITSSIQLYDKK